MKGFVPTPPHLVDAMVAKLFRARVPFASDTLLDPGCGTGAFIEGVLRWCAKQSLTPPQIIGVDSDPTLLRVAAESFNGRAGVSLREADFLSTMPAERFEYIVGNPPYVSITGLSTEERTKYRSTFATAHGRFDLYLLFFERALSLLKPEGRLVFVTPEKFLYVQSASKLRAILSRMSINEIELVEESSFEGLVTYPAITTVDAQSPSTGTRFVDRDGSARTIQLIRSVSWLPAVKGHYEAPNASTLDRLFKRISCGVATGADRVFVHRKKDLPAELSPFAFPTIAGRQLVADEPLEASDVLLTPYSRDGRLIPESELGALGDYLRTSGRLTELTKRTCVSRKPWYAFHETPPLEDILQPKILCKDIGAKPWFTLDEEGSIVPRHSVYYLVPQNQDQLPAILDFLNSQAAINWLMAHCQRAANGFVRLQSHVLKRLPLPAELVEEPLLAIA